MTPRKGIGSKALSPWDKVHRNLETVLDNFIVDTSEDAGVEHFNTFLTTMTYILGRNALFTGEYGFGKTTAAKTLMCAFSGVPYDLLEAVQIEGHPQQTHAMLVGRPDYHEMIVSGDKTIFNFQWFMPAYLLDEINRLPEGHQEILLTAVDTGRINSPLGHTIHRGKMPFFATVNYKTNGDGLLLPAMLDRFDVACEWAYTGPGNRNKMLQFEVNRERQLTLGHERLEDFMNKLGNPNDGPRVKFGIVKELLQSFTGRLNEHGLYPLTPEDIAALREDIKRMQFTQDAHIFFDMIETEMNCTAKNGQKRSEDLVVYNEENIDTHGIGFASGLLKNAMSPRASRALDFYSKALARFIGTEKVEKSHVAKMAQYVLWHRLQPIPEFRASVEGNYRITGGPMNFELAYKMIEAVEQRYERLHTQLAILYNWLDPVEKPKLSADQQDVARKLVKAAKEKPDEIEHPLMRYALMDALGQGLVK